MEVEARFAIPDHDTLMRLLRIVRLESFTPGEVCSYQVLDRYLDTAERTLYENGLACRVRVGDKGRWVTIKSMGEVEAAIHRRFEIEIELPAEADIDPHTWPEWEGRDQVLSLIGDAPLEVLFTVEQTRHTRELRADGRLVAQLSIDEIEVRAGDQERSLCLLEAELAPEGNIEELRALCEHLTTTWGLLPEPRTKFQIGMNMLDAGTEVEESEQLTPEELERLEYLAEHSDDERVRERAQLILGRARGERPAALAARLGRSRSWAYNWLSRFRDDRMAIFAAEEAPVAAYEDEEPPLTAGLPTAEEKMTVEEMCALFQVDMAHARCVADHALALFDATASLHKLGEERRPLLEVMGILHNVGLDTDPDRHHIAGRDIVLAHPLKGLSEIERRMLAAGIYLHRKRFKRKRLKAEVIASLPPGIKEDTLAMAALLRMADGLDYSQSQTTVIEHVQVSSTAVRVSVTGPYAQVDAARAQRKADLWDSLFDRPFFFVTEGSEPKSAEVAEPAAVVEQSPLVADAPGIVADDSMGEAGRKVLHFHFMRMLAHEPGTRAGEDIEELHDMRVATRRMRAAFRVFAPYFKARAVRPYVAGLRRTARVLGAVRDLDVLVHKAREYLATLPPEQVHDLDPLFSAWQEERRRARKRLLAYLDSAKYRDFVEAFRLFLETPEAGLRKVDDFPPRPVRVSHAVPRLIYARWGRVQAFDPLLQDASIAVLHALRIECKRLRYTLEFFREVLGAEVKKVIAEVVRLQDHLGDLHDADVANALLSEFLFSTREQASGRVIAPGVVAYLAFRQRELKHLIDTLPQAWTRFNRPEVRHMLAAAIAAL